MGIAGERTGEVNSTAAFRGMNGSIAYSRFVVVTIKTYQSLLLGLRVVSKEQERLLWVMSMADRMW